MSVPLAKAITPLHHLHSSQSLPLPPTTLFFTRPPQSQKSKRSTLTTTTTSAASTTEPTLGLEGDEEQGEKVKEGNITKVAERWRELHGERDWEGLLDPMDPLLKSEVIKYGEMAQACYDGFDYDKTSRFCGSCKYSPEIFFSELHLPYTGYDVTRYLYATASNALSNFFLCGAAGQSWSQKANWIGYVAVSNDSTTRRIGRRDIVVAWRGTVTKLEWVADLMNYLVDFPGDTKSGLKVESGFLGLYTKREKDCGCMFSHYSAREQVLAEIGRLIRHYSTKKSEEVSITITGHSLGAALAMLSAYDIAAMGVNGKAPLAVISFAGPRVGNRQFKEAVEAAGVKVLRVVNVHDKVPKVPGMIVNEKVPEKIGSIADKWLPWSYSHVGVELTLDHEHSPFLKETSDVGCYHNLEAHLHLLDGYHGKGREFILSIGRDIALVNKASAFLKDDHQVPPHWRQDENKGMIRTPDGRWMQPERPKGAEYDPEIEYHLQQIGFSSPN